MEEDYPQQEGEQPQQWQQQPPQNEGEQPQEQWQQPQDQWQQPYPQQPPSPSMFSSEGINKAMGMALLIGVVIMLVGAILVASSGFIEVDDQDSANLRRNLDAAGVLIAAIGVFLPAIITSFALFKVDDLSEEQTMKLVLIAAACLLGLAILANATAGSMGWF